MKNRLECMQSIRFLAVLLMCCLSYTTWAQTQSNVNGLVTDFSGEPLIGVSILVKGTSNGTVTDLDGKFSLSAEMGNMLQISYVGYISQEVKVESDKLLRIIMEEDTKNLRKNGRMRVKFDKWLVHIPFLYYLTILLISAEGAVYGGY